MPDPLFKKISNFATTHLFNEVWDYNIDAEISEDMDMANNLQQAKIPIVVRLYSNVFFAFFIKVF